MTDSIDIPTHDRRSRRMRHQEYPGAEAHSPSQPISPSSVSKGKTPMASRQDVAAIADLEDDSLYSTPSSLGAPSSIGGSPALPTAMRMAGSRDKGKGRAVDSTPASTEPKASQASAGRRTSFMGESISRTEHTVIDIGDPDGTPRLITCVKTGQGFAWNPELLLPSYLCDRNNDLDRRQDPVQDIILTEEEMECMFPQ